MTYLPRLDHARQHTHADSGDGSSISPAGLILPSSASPAPTVEGQAIWNSALDHLAIGDGAATQLLYPQLTGTWTPGITFGTPGDLNVVYSARVGEYTLLGREVIGYVALTTSTFTHSTASGALQITGLPFTIATPGDLGAGVGLVTGWTITVTSGATILRARSATTYLTTLVFGSAGAFTEMNATHYASGAVVRVWGSFRYYI